MEAHDDLTGLKVLSVEHMIALPYCTWRLALRGAQVLRVEPPWGDPVRFTGKKFLDEEGMNAYFFNANTMKKSVTLNLREQEGREIIGRLVEEWAPDIFATNLLPCDYEKRGVDYERLKGIKGDLIWVGLSGFGPDRSEAAYDPVIQAYAGLADTNGEPDSPPLKLGISITDLEAANQAYTEIIHALLHRERTGEGSRLDISLLQVTLSLLALHMPTLGLGFPIPKTGNSHPQFAPVGMYPTRDGHLMIALGNDSQFDALASIPGFGSLKRPEWKTNVGRSDDADKLNATIIDILKEFTSDAVMELLKDAAIPVARATSLEGVLEDPYLKGHLIPVRDEGKGVETYNAPLPVGQPCKEELGLPPRLGEQNEDIYGGLGLDVAGLRERKII